MEITSQQVKELRERTGIGMMECKKALEEAGGDAEKAVLILRKKGFARAEKKAERTTTAGLIGSYIHMTGKIGVLVQVNCESDFVARNEEFQALVKNIALHIAAANPKYLGPEDIPTDVLEVEKSVVREQFKDSKKPAEVVEKIVLGKLTKFYEEVCLVEQPFVKDDKTTIKQLVQSHVAKFGENIKIDRFARFEIADD
jgi:elongation factor Ts